MDVGSDIFTASAETWKSWGSGELKASERNRAISLSVNPTGTGATGCGSGSTAGNEEDRRWCTNIAASGSPILNGCCSAKISECWSKEFGSKGDTIICGPASMESVENIDLGLERLNIRRRFKKATIPITTKMAATPPIVLPTIVPMFQFRFLEDGFVFGVFVPSRVIVYIGMLRGVIVRDRKMEGPLCTNFRANGANTAPCAGLTL